MTPTQLIAAGVVLSCAFAAGVLAASVVLQARHAKSVDRLQRRNRELWHWSSRKQRKLRADMLEADARVVQLLEEREEWMDERAGRAAELN